MRKFIYTAGIIGLASLTLLSCKKEAQTTAAVQQDVSQDVLTQINSLGFSTSNVQKVDEGYLVEGDIVLTQSDLTSASSSPALRIANTEQYRTNNLVTALPRTIKVAVSTSLPSSYVTALDEAIRRYNAEGLLVTFTRVSSGYNILLTKAPTGSSYLASAGFPSGGNPYSQVLVNSTAIGSGTTTTWNNYAATIIAHEMGHCIGFRHTDYMDRSYSCGGAYTNEGASTVGAINIPGTPTTADAGSWMLACVAANQNRYFNANDKIALAYLY